MSGHSHWSTIKHKKGAADAKRSKLYSKLSRAITISVREGGGNTDPSSNARLRLAIDQAQTANITKDKIKKAIERGTGIGKEGNITSAKFGGMVFNNIALIIEVETDNKNRTTAKIRHSLESKGGKMVSPESVETYFKTAGIISIAKGNKGDEELFELALDVGADDVKSDEDTADIITAPTKLGDARKKLEEQGVDVQYAQLAYLTKIPMSLSSDKEAEQMEKLVNELEENDDVTNVYTNATETSSNGDSTNIT